MKEINVSTGTDISTSPLAPASEFKKKGLSGKYILVFTCPNWQADILNTKHIVDGPNTHRYANNAIQLKRYWFSYLYITKLINNSCLSSIYLLTYFGQVKTYFGQVKIINDLLGMAS